MLYVWCNIKEIFINVPYVLHNDVYSTGMECSIPCSFIDQACQCCIHFHVLTDSCLLDLLVSEWYVKISFSVNLSVSTWSYAVFALCLIFLCYGIRYIYIYLELMNQSFHYNSPYFLQCFLFNAFFVINIPTLVCFG